MLREAIGTGATVEEAKEAACKELGVETYDDHIEFEILEMPPKSEYSSKERLYRQRKSTSTTSSSTWNSAISPYLRQKKIM